MDDQCDKVLYVDIKLRMKSLNVLLPSTSVISPTQAITRIELVYRINVNIFFFSQHLKLTLTLLPT